MAVKKLSELTVAELKHELKKRKLDFTGEKAVLLARLRKSLVEDANRAKLAQQQLKAKEEEKKPAEETPVVQKKEDVTNASLCASITEDCAKSSMADSDSTLNASKSLDADVSTLSNVNLSEVNASMTQSEANTSTTQSEANTSMARLEASVCEMSTAKEVETVEKQEAQLRSEPVAKAEGKTEQPVGTPGLTGESRREGVGKEERGEPEKMEVEESDCKIVESETENDRREGVVPEAMVCESTSQEDSKVDAVGASERLDEGAAAGGEEAPLDHKTEAEKPTLENVHVTAATDAAVPKLNESGTAPEKPEANVKTLWVSGMIKVVKASDLKQAFNQYGRVISAKIVTSAKYPGSRCFGLVTMFSHEDALRCIEGFNGKTLLGSVVNVELDTKHRVTRPQANRQAAAPQADPVETRGVTEVPPEDASQKEATPPAGDAPKAPAQAPLQPQKCEEVCPPAEVKKSEVIPPAKADAPKALPKPVVAPAKPTEAAGLEKAEVSTSVWLSGFPNTIKAAELKAFCLGAGKVMAAKVVANSKLQTYYGLVTMATAEDAKTCLKKLNDTMYNETFKITCELSPSNTVTAELLKYFSRNKQDQAQQQQSKPTGASSPAGKPQPSVPANGSTPSAQAPKPQVANSVAQKPATSSTSPPAKPATNVQKKQQEMLKNNANKKGKMNQKKAPLMKTPPSSNNNNNNNRNFRRTSPRGRPGMNRYGGNMNSRGFSGILDGGGVGMMGRPPFGGGGRSMMDDRRSLVYLEEERRITQEMAMLNAQREKLQIETLRLEREREKMEAERARQDQMAMQRRNEWKPLVPMKRPHEQEEVCWRPPPQSAAKRFVSEYEVFQQASGRRPPLLDDRDVRHLDRNMGGPSLLGPRGSFSMGQGRFQEYY